MPNSTRMPLGRQDWSTEPQPRLRPHETYCDPHHRRLEKSGRELLSAALKASVRTDQSLDALWVVFRDFVRAHEFSEAIAAQLKSLSAELEAVIRDEHGTELRAKALETITRELRAEVRSALTEQLSRELAPEVEREVRASVRQQHYHLMLKELSQELRRTLRPQIDAEIREELRNSPKVMEEVVSDLKRRILDL